MTTKQVCLLAAVLAFSIWLGACADRSEKDEDTSRPATFGFQTGLDESLIAEGRLAYERYCIGCHGAQGDGNGDAAVFLNPKPRNFVNAQYKFSSTRSGQLPKDEDLKRTIKNGLRGSAMPAFNLLPERKVDALVAYLKTFSPKWKEREPAAAIPIVGNPYISPDDRAEAIARGEKIYHGYAACWSCHPSYVSEEKINQYLVALGGSARTEFRSNLFEPEGKPNDEGDLVYPPDFKRDFIRAGMQVEDLYRSIAAGISGTAMPTWVDSIHVGAENPDDPPIVSQADLWAMAYYVQELIAQRPALLAEAQVDVRDRARPIYLHGEPPASPVEAPATSQPADTDFEF